MPQNTTPGTNRFISNAHAAFTLVELLVVIAIIGVLVSLILPALGKARLQAQKVVCASQQRQICLAWTAYATDNKQWFSGTDFNAPYVSTAVSAYIGSTPVELVAVRFKRVPILACPGTRASDTNIPVAYIPGTIQPGATDFVSSYFYPGATADYSADASRYFYGWQGLWTGQSTTNVPNTSAPCPNVEFAGRVKKSPDPGPLNAGMTMWIEIPSKQPLVVDAYNVPGALWSFNSRFWFPNHADGVNVGFVDGHSEFRASEYIQAKHRGIYW
jgi:prepilin-type N-terminal cleavage/methylation domain-containing protein/prepilin-type processing-associated H-X9-DG protein